jgi:S1-C subfamily serine protease
MDGGALIDLHGRIVGLYVSPPDAPAFVVPIRRAMQIAQRLRTTPPSSKGIEIGLTVQDLDHDLREYFQTEDGVLVTSIKPGGWAEKTGLRISDIIARINEVPMKSGTQLLATLRDAKLGTEARFEIRRANQRRILTGKLPAAPVASVPSQDTMTLKVANAISGSGVSIVSVHPAARAAQIGLASGDEVVSVNGRPIRNSAELQRSIGTNPSGKILLLLIKRNSQEFFVAVREPIDVDG